MQYDELSSALGFVTLLPNAPAPPEPTVAPAAPASAAGKSKKASKPAAAPAAAPVVPTGPVKRDDTGPLPELVGNKNFPGCEANGKFFVTTAISYTNGMPHIGHAYESLTADVLARWHRVYGRRVFSMTGTDEHGQKIANAAEQQGIQPIDICNKYSSEFIKLNRRMLVSNDRFIRTTEAEHKATCQELWKRCAANGDIYLDTYKGWYLEREETFVTPKDAEEWNFKDPQTGVPLKEMEEQSYFFRLSKYAQPLKDLYKANPSSCLPDDRRAQIEAQLEDLHDLSISRTSFQWGIPVPEGFDQKHVMYVWFDALTNYLSGVHGDKPEHELASFWPADAHIIGKDIIRFHSVYWPAMLLSAGLPVPKSVFSHGFINAGDGRKMSKSFGNVIDPHDMLDKYPADTLRFYLCSEAPFGSDVKFSEECLVRMHNGPLADTLGNLLHRGTNLAKTCGVPDVEGSPGLQEAFKSLTSDPATRPIDVAGLIAQLDGMYNAFELLGARDLAMEATRNVNNWIAKLEPWKMKEDKADLRLASFRVLLECLYVLAHFFAPLLPAASTEILRRLGTPSQPIASLNCEFNNLVAGTPVEHGLPLFPKLLEPGAEPSPAASSSNGKSANALAAAAGKAKKEADKAEMKAKQQATAAAKGAGGNGGKSEGGEKEASTAGKAKPAGAAPKGGSKKGAKGEKPPKAPKGGAAAAPDGGGEDVEDCCKLDLRVGTIVDAFPHPESEKLWVEKIDVGEETGPRNICSGLRAFYATAQDLIGQSVVVVANLKNKKMGGVDSFGMVACASSPDHSVVKFVVPPQGSKPGDRVTFEGLPVVAPASGAQIAKKKIAETVIFGGQLVTVAGGGCTYKGTNAMVVEGVGPCTAPVPEGYMVA